MPEFDDPEELLDGWILDDAEGATLDVQQGFTRRQGAFVRHCR